MHKYYVVHNDVLTPGTIRLRLRADAKAKRLIKFEPGQYAAISFKRHGRPSVARCFSIVSSPNHPEELQFSMRARGRFTTALSHLPEGSEVDVRGPFGGFVFDQERHSDSILIAGGIGITPFMSMMTYATEIGSLRHLQLIYGVQTQDDVPFLSELKDLHARNPNLSVTLAVDRGEVEKLAPLSTSMGRISPELLQQVLDNGGKTVFICGPPPFMNGIAKTLVGLGVPRQRIITEAFNQGSHHQTGKVVSWPQNMYVLGAVGVGLGSLAVMVSDIMKNLPTSLVSDEAASIPLKAGDTRQQAIDQMVNQLQANQGSVDSPTLTAALANASAASASNSTTTTRPTQPAAPAPAPIVTQPKCTTSQSGTVTCV